MAQTNKPSKKNNRKSAPMPTEMGGFWGFAEAIGLGKASLLEWGRTLLIAGGLALVIRWAIAEPYKIPSGSMEPTLHGAPGLGQGDRVFVNKWIYGLRWPLNDFRIPFTHYTIHYTENRIFRLKAPQRWDIVVFKTVEKDTKADTLVKRIVGMPGERIHIANGKVYVNGEPLELPPGMPPVQYTSPMPGFTDMRYGVIDSDMYSIVPPDHYLVLGDNSARSRDGRVWGWLPGDHIVGRVFSIWWPPTRWRDFTGFSDTWWWRVIVAMAAALTIWRLFFGRSWRVPSPSPDAALRSKEHLFIHRAAYGIPIPFTGRRFTAGRPPRRGELVLYLAEDKDEKERAFLLGRIAGLPGEKVFLDEGRLTINGEPVKDAPLAGRVYPASNEAGPYARSKSREYSEAPEGCYFILADTLEAGPDGRALGWTPKQNLIGPVQGAWWPIPRWLR